MENKSKKFTAAEKHFLKKEEQYRKQIKELEAQLHSVRSENESLKKTAMQYTELLEQHHKALELLQLSNDDIKKLLSAADKVDAMRHFVLTLMGGVYND